MAMNAAQQQFIRRTAHQTRLLIGMYADLCQLNALWAGTPNYDTLITQADIDEIPEFSGAGLTTQNLADVEFTLASIKTSIENTLVAIAVIAATS